MMVILLLSVCAWFTGFPFFFFFLCFRDWVPLSAERCYHKYLDDFLQVLRSCYPTDFQLLLIRNGSDEDVFWTLFLQTTKIIMAFTPLHLIRKDGLEWEAGLRKKKKKNSEPKDLLFTQRTERSRNTVSKFVNTSGSQALNYRVWTWKVLAV